MRSPLTEAPSPTVASRIGLLLLSIVALGAIVASSLYSFLLFHTVAELFSICIAAGLFVVAWNTREMAENSVMVSLGIGYLFVAVIDLAHTMAHSGMGVFASPGRMSPRSSGSQADTWRR